MYAAPMDLNRLELTGPASPLIEGVAHDHFRGADFDVSASGTLVYRRRITAGNRAVLWIDSSGATARVLEKAGAYSTPRLSPDGKRLASATASVNPATAEAEARVFDRTLGTELSTPLGVSRWNAIGFGRSGRPFLVDVHAETLSIRDLAS